MRGKAVSLEESFAMFVVCLGVRIGVGDFR